MAVPGESHGGPPPPLSAEQRRLRDSLRRDVEVLAGEIGERNVWTPRALAAAAAHIARELEGAAGRPAERQAFRAGGAACENLSLDLAGEAAAGEIVVVGAHYDTVRGSPGANDNASGVAAVLSLARAFAGRTGRRTLRLAAFANEEAPFFLTDEMGSLLAARRSRERGERVVAMLSLETIGYYSDEPGSQTYPFPLGAFYPDRGDFIAFVSKLSNRDLVRRVVAAFRGSTAFPCQGAAAPGLLPGIGWSDHRSYWEEGYPALMVTDTAPYRYPWYHTGDDAPDRLDYERMARVVAGLERVVEDLLCG